MKGSTPQPLSVLQTVGLLAVAVSIIIACLQLLPSEIFRRVAWYELRPFYIIVLGVVITCLVVFRDRLHKHRLLEPAFLLGIISLVMLTSLSPTGVAGYARLSVAIVFLAVMRMVATMLPVRVVAITLAALVCLQAVWGVAQFSLQDDLGLQYLGESNLGDSLAGIATFSVIGVGKLSRAYGSLLHANSLGGIAALALIGLLSVLVQENNVQQLRHGVRTHAGILLILAYVLTLAVIVSFSRSALLAAGMVWALYFIFEIKSIRYDMRPEASLEDITMRPRRMISIIQKNIPFSIRSSKQSTSRQTLAGRTSHSACMREGTTNDAIIWSVFARSMLPICVTLIVFMPLLNARQSDTNDVAVSERWFGVRQAFMILDDLPVWRGTGIDTYPLFLRQHLDAEAVSYQSWQIPPVHMVPLLLIVEFGLLVGGAVLILFFWMVVRLGRTAMWLIPMTPLVVLDHYLYSHLGPAVVAIALFVILEHVDGVDEQSRIR